MEAKACRVEWLGSQRAFIAGEAQEPVSLERFANLKGLYAVGPLEQGRGEVSIFNGMPLVSKVESRDLRIDRDFSHRAEFLVYAIAQHWYRTVIQKPVNSDADFETALLLLAVVEGINVDEPFPFLFYGHAARATRRTCCGLEREPQSAYPDDEAQARFSGKRVHRD
jgi:hypothetical protein